MMSFRIPRAAGAAATPSEQLTPVGDSLSPTSVPCGEAAPLDAAVVDPWAPFEAALAVARDELRLW